MSEMIQIKTLKKVFVSDKNTTTALDGIDLSIEKREIFGIIGLSGAGKSTLVRCINYLEKPTSGAVAFDGKDLGSMDKKELRKARQSIGMIFQGFHLLMQRTALRNVCFPLEIAGVSKKEAERKAKEMLNLVGIADKAHAYPAQLSGGQKQRLSIARAIAKKPEILIFDDSFSALDFKTDSKLRKALKEKTKDITTIIVAQRISTILNADQIIVLDDGNMAGIGTHKELMKNCEVYRQIAMSQLSEEELA